MYRASDRVANEEWLAELEAAADRLELGPEARSVAADCFLSAVPATDRSKRAALAASLYAGARIAGDGRSQTDVAEAMDVSRLTIQQRWKGVIADAGLEPPTW